MALMYLLFFPFPGRLTLVFCFPARVYNGLRPPPLIRAVVFPHFHEYGKSLFFRGFMNAFFLIYLFSASSFFSLYAAFSLLVPRRLFSLHFDLPIAASMQRPPPPSKTLFPVRAPVVSPAMYSFVIHCRSASFPLIRRFLFFSSHF